MSEVADKIVEFLGFSMGEDTTLDQFKSWSDSNLVNVKGLEDNKLVKEYVGRRLGTNHTSTKKAFKDAGVEFEDGSANDFGQMLEAATKYLNDRKTGFESKIESIKNGSPDKTKDLEDKIAEIVDLKRTNKDLNETVKSLKTGISEKEEAISRAEVEKEGFIFSQLRSSKHSGLGLDPNADKYKVKGFFAEMNEKFKTKLETTVGEDGKKSYSIDIRTPDGDQVPNPDKHGEFLGYEDVYKRGAAEAKLLKINKDGGKEVPSNPPTQRVSTNTTTEVKANFPSAKGSKVSYARN